MSAGDIAGRDSNGPDTPSSRPVTTTQRCQRPNDHRPHDYVLHPSDSEQIECPGGPVADLELIAMAARTIAAAGEKLDHAVARARAGRRSYADIGRALGVSRQAAWERFHHLDPAAREQQERAS